MTDLPLVEKAQLVSPFDKVKNPILVFLVCNLVLYFAIPFHPEMMLFLSSFFLIPSVVKLTSNLFELGVSKEK